MRRKHVLLSEKVRNAYKYLVGKTEGNGPHDSPGLRRNDRLHVGREVVNWTLGSWWVLAVGGCTEGGGFLVKPSGFSFLRDLVTTVFYLV